MILILVGKSGSGKTTLANYFNDNGILNKVVTVTTRPRRTSEIDGVDYHFYSERDFLTASSNGAFIEIENYNDWHYGTLKSSIEPNKNLVLILTPSGLERFKKYASDRGILYKSVYLDVDDETRLNKCLSEREDKEEVMARFERDNVNHRNARFKCDLTIINNNFEYSTENIANRIKEALFSI